MSGFDVLWQVEEEEQYMVARRLRMTVLAAPDDVVASDGMTSELGRGEYGELPHERGWTTFKLVPNIEKGLSLRVGDGQLLSAVRIPRVNVTMFNLPREVQRWLLHRLSQPLVVEWWDRPPDPVKAPTAWAHTLLRHVRMSTPDIEVEDDGGFTLDPASAIAYPDSDHIIRTLCLTTEPVPDPTVPPPGQ